MPRPGRLLTRCPLLPRLAGALFGQGSSGTISGRVVDPTGSPVPGAEVKIQNDVIKDVRTFTSAQDGEFVFADIQPGTYTLTVKAPGFKLLQKSGLVLTANAVLGAGDMQLALGAATEVVEVKADATGLQTASGDRVQTLDNKVMDLMALALRVTF